MQPVSIIALSALLGYWLAHFVGRPESWKEGRMGGALSATLVQYGLTLGLIGLFDSHLLSKPRVYWVLLIAVMLQGLLATRWLFSRLALRESLWGFLALHAFAAAVSVAAAMLVLRLSPGEAMLGWHWADDAKRKFLIAAVVYVATIFGGGYLVRYMTRPLLPEQSLEAGLSVEELKNAGLYIGWLERFLVMTALLLQSPASIGLILTGKSVARFPELKTERFAEYFLIGTFLSISIAIAGGMLLVYLLYGTFAIR